MSEKIKAAVARMRQRIATSQPCTLSEAVKLDDMRTLADAAEAALPPEPRDHVVIYFDPATRAVGFLDCKGHLMTQTAASDLVLKWGREFRDMTYTVAKVNIPAAKRPETGFVCASPEQPATIARREPVETPAHPGVTR